MEGLQIGVVRMSKYEIRVIEMNLNFLLEEYKSFEKGCTCNWSNASKMILEDEQTKEMFIKRILNNK